MINNLEPLEIEKLQPVVWQLASLALRGGRRSLCCACSRDAWETLATHQVANEISDENSYQDAGAERLIAIYHAPPAFSIPTKRSQPWWRSDAVRNVP